MAGETVKVLKPLVHESQVREIGETLTVPVELASQWIERGLAEPMVRIRITREHAIVGRKVCAAGDELSVSSEEAIGAHRRWVADILNPDALSSPLPERDPHLRPVEKAAPVDPYAGCSMVRVVAGQNGAMFNSTAYSCGDVLDMAEEIAVRDLLKGNVALAPGAKLTQRGEAYRGALKASRRQYDRPEPEY